MNASRRGLLSLLAAAPLAAAAAARPPDPFVVRGISITGVNETTTELLSSIEGDPEVLRRPRELRRASAHSSSGGPVEPPGREPGPADFPPPAGWHTLENVR